MPPCAFPSTVDVELSESELIQVPRDLDDSIERPARWYFSAEGYGA
jgi:hypothetical protein